MSVIYVLLGISITVAVVFFVVFILAVKRGQYDDVYTPSVRMLFDDELIKEPTMKSKEKSAQEKPNKQVLTKEKES